MINIVQDPQEITKSASGAKNSSVDNNTIPNSINILPGLEGPIKALLEVVSYPLLFPEQIQQLNIECPKGILLHGPPGVGKTLLVSTVAHICKATMITIYGPEIFGPYVGESEEKLRQKFDQASRIATANSKTPVIVFIDELDALTPHRNDAQAHESRVVAQLLTLMDGVASRGRVVVVAATNRPNSIDPALRRPGRFDREIRMEVPREADRTKIIKGLIKDMPHTLSDEELGMLARMTNGFVGADLEALCRESALKAVHRNVASLMEGNSGSASPAEVKVTMADFKKAFSTNAPSLQRGYGVVVEPVRWTDIGGLESVKTQLRQAVEWPVLHKDTFARLGLKAPRGILLYGPPGCSKTTLVKAIATNSGASFLSVNGAALYSSFVGDSEKTIRETFHQARLSAPSIIFFDEIDTIVGKRNFSAGGSGSGGDSVQERVLSTMLNEMDGVENAAGVLIVAATNRVDLIDKALLRPGRFDRVVYVSFFPCMLILGGSSAEKLFSDNRLFLLCRCHRRMLKQGGRSWTFIPEISHCQRMSISIVSHKQYVDNRRCFSSALIHTPSIATLTRMLFNILVDKHVHWCRSPERMPRGCVDCASDASAGRCCQG